MRVLITGATGLIGQEVGKKLVAAGHEIVAVSRNPMRAKTRLPFPAEVHAWQLKSEFPREAIENVEAVIHLSGESIANGRWSEEKKREIRDSRVLGTRALVEAIMKASRRPRVFLQGSAVGIYGSQGDVVLTEAAEIGKDFLAGVVREWEVESAPLDEIGLRVVKIRTAPVFSRNGGALGQLVPVFSAGLGGKLGNGQQWMSWIHVEDISRAVVFCLENEAVNGPINATSPEPARNERLTVALARALGRPVFFPIPMFALRAVLGEAAWAIVASQRVVPTKLLELGFQFRFPELVPALEELCAPLKGGQHEFLSEQWLPLQPQELFPFFSQEKNLEELTPPFLKFHLVGKSTDKLGTGTLIDYRLSLHGMPIKWRTRIESWQQNVAFVDTQLRGPYRKWVHTHEFIPVAGGTLIRDRVNYQLPLGYLGDAVASRQVSRDVAEIFNYRRRAIAERFGAKQ